MRNALAFTVAGAVGALVACGAGAGSLKVQCGGYVIDYTKSTSVIGGVARAISITNYSESDKSFHILISPPDGISRNRASLQAALQADIICMQLDAKPVEARFVELSNDAWVFSSGCEGHWVRRESKC